MVPWPSTQPNCWSPRRCQFHRKRQVSPPEKMPTADKVGAASFRLGEAFIIDKVVANRDIFAEERVSVECLTAGDIQVLQGYEDTFDPLRAALTVNRRRERLRRASVQYCW